MLFLLPKLLKMFSSSSAPKKERKLAASGYVVLNVIRALNIIALLLVVVGSWIMLVRTVQTSSVRYSNPN